MPDMENQNLDKLRQSVGANPPTLSESLLTQATSSSTRKPLRYAGLLATAAIAATLFSLATSPKNAPAVFAFPSSAPRQSAGGVKAGGLNAGLMFQTGVDFTAGPGLSSKSGQGEVWQVRAVDGLRTKMNELAGVLDDNAPIKVDDSGWSADLGTLQLSEVTSTGYWNYFNARHGVTVDGVCLDTKRSGNCVIEHKNLGDEHYRAEAYRLFSAGGWTGSADEIKLANDGFYTTATASLLVSGKVSPINWRADWYSDGVLSSSHGFMSDIVPLGEFEMVSPLDSVARADDYRLWTDQGANIGGPWAPPVAGEAATVTKADTVLGFYRGYLVPSYYLHGDSGKWYRQVLALAEPEK